MVRSDFVVSKQSTLCKLRLLVSAGVGPARSAPPSADPDWLPSGRYNPDPARLPEGNELQHREPSSGVAGLARRPDTEPADGFSSEQVTTTDSIRR